MALAAQRSLPTPPEPVIPPEGLTPSPTATETTASPTTMVLNYLQSRGYQPTSENVRRALEANSRDPGVIPGLRSDTAAIEADDQAAMARARGGSGGSRALPTPPVPPEGATPSPTGGDPNTSAAPAPQADSGTTDKLLATAGILAPSIASAILARRPVVGGSVAPMPDPGGGVPTRPGATPGMPGGGPGEIDYTQMGGEGNRLLPGDATNAAPTPMQQALTRATAPASSPSLVEGVAPVAPGTVANMHTGPATLDPAQVNEAAIRSGAQPPPQMPPTSSARGRGGAEIPTITVTPRGPAPRAGRIPVGKLRLR